MTNTLTICWFRQDLRLTDNPALSAAAETGSILPIFILDDVNAKEWRMGAATRWWLHHSLTSLQESLGGKLYLFKGNPKKILLELAKNHKINKVVWNRCYEPWRIQRDTEIKQLLADNHIETESFNGSLLWEPWEALKKDDTPYKVFTPFYRRGCLGSPMPPRKIVRKPQALSLYSKKVSALTLNDLNLLPKVNWCQTMKETWGVGEVSAKIKLKKFLQSGLKNYKEGRDFPALNSVSRLSPHLHFGEISPHQIWYAAKKLLNSENLEHFLREIVWREFSYSLLYHNPKLPDENLQEKFNFFPWKNSKNLLKAWQQGQTGYPIVDAGMRELWQTGYMHNRVRMIVGSFLVKNLLLHWTHGEVWFWDCLVDADLASNSASWQWVAGCGADAAPYFRIFNPITQGEKFDADGEYTLKYVPELSRLPKKFLFKPWDAPEEVLSKAGIKLGHDYPKPIVELKTSREKALSAFSSLKDLNW